ncbi:MAG: hypothetical protein IKI77_09135 [Oscillospiraceae bacterium]|nr:hypothetical protein [Oscillospiraceae bacterium]
MNKMKKLTAALLAVMVTLPVAACGEKIENSKTDSSSLSESQSADESSGAENSGESSEGAGDSSGAENGQAEDSSKNEAKQADLQAAEENVVYDEDGQRNQKLTFSENFTDNTPVNAPFRGEDGNYYVAKTDINGNIAVNGNGETQTEIVKEPGKIDYQVNYTPAIKSYQAFWLDISQKKDYVFDGNLLEYQIEVAPDAPDGVYPVEIYYTDFSNYDAQSLKDVQTITGYVCVNKDAPAAEEVGDKMTLSAENISVKPGDTARMNIRIDNNPGIVAFVVRVHYDENIVTIKKAAAGSDLGKRARLTTNTLDDDE